MLYFHKMFRTLIALALVCMALVAEQEAHATSQLLIIDQRQLIHVSFRQGERVRHRERRAEAVGNRRYLVYAPRLASLSTTVHRIGTFRLYTDHFNCRVELFDGIRNARNETSPSDRYNQRIERVDLLADLEPDRARAERDLRSLERMHKIAPFVSLDPVGKFECLVHIVSQHNFRAELTARGNA